MFAWLLYMTVTQGSKCVFFHIASENCHGNDKKCVHISASVSQQLYLSSFVLFRNVCFLFLILE